MVNANFLMPEFFLPMKIKIPKIETKINKTKTNSIIIPILSKRLFE